MTNRSEIKDEEEFAEEVIEMCRANSFRSLRLSTDIEGWPEKLDIRDAREKYHMTIRETE